MPARTNARACVCYLMQKGVEWHGRMFYGTILTHNECAVRCIGSHTGFQRRQNTHAHLKVRIRLSSLHQRRSTCQLPAHLLPLWKSKSSSSLSRSVTLSGVLQNHQVQFTVLFTEMRFISLRKHLIFLPCLTALHPSCVKVAQSLILTTGEQLI